MRQTPHGPRRVAAAVGSQHETPRDPSSPRPTTACPARARTRGLRALRQGLLADATGRVLEIGAGTGANLSLYNRSDRRRSSSPSRSRRCCDGCREARTTTCRSRRSSRAPAEHLPFEDDVLRHGRLDARPVRRRRPGAGAARGTSRASIRCGRLLFLEHVRVRRSSLARLQDRMNWLNRLVVDATATGRRSRRSKPKASRCRSCSARSCRRRRSSSGR